MSVLCMRLWILSWKNPDKTSAKYALFYCERSQAESFEQDENVEPCVWRRMQGNVACRDGIIEKIQMDILRGGNFNV